MSCLLLNYPPNQWLRIAPIPFTWMWIRPPIKIRYYPRPFSILVPLDVVNGYVSLQFLRLDVNQPSIKIRYYHNYCLVFLCAVESLLLSNGGVSFQALWTISTYSNSILLPLSIRWDTTMMLRFYSVVGIASIPFQGRETTTTPVKEYRSSSSSPCFGHYSILTQNYSTFSTTHTIVSVRKETNKWDAISETHTRQRLRIASIDFYSLFPILRSPPHIIYKIRSDTNQYYYSILPTLSIRYNSPNGHLDWILSGFSMKRLWMPFCWTMYRSSIVHSFRIIFWMNGITSTNKDLFRHFCRCYLALWIFGYLWILVMMDDIGSELIG